MRNLGTARVQKLSIKRFVRKDGLIHWNVTGGNGEVVISAQKGFKTPAAALQNARKKIAIIKRGRVKAAAFRRR